MKYLCIALIRFYRKYLSRLKRNPTCRFTPTCSAYALEAYQKRGFFAGTVLTVWRILRCNPYCAGGYDPVPEHGFRNRDTADGGSLAYNDGQGANDVEITESDGDGEREDEGAADMENGDDSLIITERGNSAETPQERERKEK